MIIVLLLLFVIIGVLLAAVSGLYWRLQGNGDREHAKCIAHITQYMGDEYAAMVLKAAAHDWDSAEEASRLKVLARLKHKQGGPSMPAIWLNDRAERLRGTADAAVMDYAFATQAD